VRAHKKEIPISYQFNPGNTRRCRLNDKKLAKGSYVASLSVMG
jgi:hypothetical protein